MGRLVEMTKLWGWSQDSDPATAPSVTSAFPARGPDGQCGGPRTRGELQLAGRQEQGLATLVCGCAWLSGLARRGRNEVRGAWGLWTWGEGDPAACEIEGRGSASIGTRTRIQHSTCALYSGIPQRGVVLIVHQTEVPCRPIPQWLPLLPRGGPPFFS